MDDATRSDCLVEIEPGARGGITLELESKVASLYGDSIRAGLAGACEALGLSHAAFRIIDQGALPYVLGARIEAAVKRALPDTVKEFLPPRAGRRKAPNPCRASDHRCS